MEKLKCMICSDVLDPKTLSIYGGQETSIKCSCKNDLTATIEEGCIILTAKDLDYVLEYDTENSTFSSLVL